MATTSLWKVESRIDHVVDYATDKDKTKNKYYNQFNNFSSVRDLLSYATNPDKTEKQFFTTGINCKVEDAVKQMELVKTLYGKEDGILAFHGYQSFAEGEVTPEIAHEIGVRLAEEMWGDRFQVVVSTHLNTEHIHNHFVVNSVSFKDGLKYYSDLSNTALLRKTSDDLCDEYGLRVLEEKTCKSGINFENFYKKSIRDSDYYKFAKEDLDYAIKHSYTQKEFHQYLSSMGYSYYYRANKLCIRREPYKRNIRVERAFGEEYSVENIRQRIIANDFIPKEKIIPYKITTLKFYGRKNIFRKAYKPKGIIALYYYYRFLLGVHKRNNVQHKLTPNMRKAIEKMDHYSEQIRFLCKYKLETIDNVNELKAKKLREKQDILNARNRLYYKRGKVHDIAYESICKIINSLPEEEEIINKILTIKQYTSINYIYNILLKNSYDFSTSNKNKLVPFLVGLYYRGNGNVTNMENDEIYEKCLAMDRDMTEQVLKKYFKKDEEYQIGNKAGKLYKYLIKKEHILCVYENLITMYNERLPQLIDFTNEYYRNYNLGDKNDILLNYFMLKLQENETRFPSTVDELLFVNLYDVKCNKNFFIKNDKAIFLALTVYAIYLSDLWLMKNSFLNWNHVTEKNIIVCEINQNKTSINMNMENCTSSIKKKIISNPRGLLAMNGHESYKYISNMFQLFDIYGGIEDRNIIKREYKIGRNSRIKYITIKQQNSNKLKKLAKVQNIYKIRSILEESLF